VSTVSKRIQDVPEDVYELLDSSQEHGHSAELAAEYAMRIGGEFAKATMKRNKPREKGKMWASDIGKPCMRYHYFNFNAPEKGEKLMGHTKFKFLYGNILEEAALYFAEEAGHEVRGQQARLEVDLWGWKVSGRIDAIVDDVLMDVKSASVYSFNKYRKEGVTRANDTFGYLYQLAFYKEFSYANPDMAGVDEEQQAFLFIDKQNGHLCVIEVQDELPSKDELLERIGQIIKSATGAERDAPRAYSPEPYGKSGNMALGIGCSYCAYKEHCWRDSNGGKGLRGFAYNHKPVWFTDVAREPKVPEITGDDNE